MHTQKNNSIIKNIYSKYNKQTKLYYKYYEGLISVKDIISSWNEAIELKLIPKEVKGCIVDYTNAIFDFNLMDDIKISDYYKDNIVVFQNWRIAVLTANLDDFVIPTLIMYEDDGYQTKPFLKLEVAINWVLGDSKCEA